MSKNKKDTLKRRKEIKLKKLLKYGKKGGGR